MCCCFLVFHVHLYWVSAVSLVNHGEGESAQLGPSGLRRGSRPRKRRRSEEKSLFQRAEEIPGYQTGKTAGMWLRGRYTAGRSCCWGRWTDRLIDDGWYHFFKRWYFCISHRILFPKIMIIKCSLWLSFLPSLFFLCSFICFLLLVGVWRLWRAAEGVLFWQESRLVSLCPPLLPNRQTSHHGGAVCLLLQVSLLFNTTNYIHQVTISHFSFCLEWK